MVRRTEDRVSQSNCAPTTNDGYFQRIPVYQFKYIFHSHNITKNLGNGPRIHVDMHLYVVSCLQRHTTIPLEGCSWWNLLWIQGEYEDCLYKMCVPLFTTDNNQEATMVATCPLKLFCPWTCYTVVPSCARMQQHCPVGSCHGPFQPYRNQCTLNV
jgi:hypothetical protein